MADLRLSTVKDEAGYSQGLILDHANGQRLTMTGSAVTSAGLNSPMAWVKNLGPGDVYLRGDGSPAGVGQAGSYLLYSGQDWPLAADNGNRTVSLAGPSGTVVSVIPAKAVASSIVLGAGGAGFGDSDVDRFMPLPSTGSNPPDVAGLVFLLKKIRVALDAVVGSVPWGAITGSIAAQSDLVAALGGKSDTTHTHTRTQLQGFGTSAALDVPATGGTASSAQAVRGDDPRLSDARTPTSHTHTVANVTGLQTALDNLRAGAASFTYRIATPSVGTYEIEEYAEAAGLLTHVTDRLTAGSASYRVQIQGSDVPGLGTSASPLAPGATQVRRAATGVGTRFELGQRTQIVVSAVTTPGVLLINLRRVFD